MPRKSVKSGKSVKKTSSKRVKKVKLVKLVRSPMSNRLIKKGGPVYEKLEGEGVVMPLPERTRPERPEPKKVGIMKQEYLDALKLTPVEYKNYRSGAKGWGEEKPESRGERRAVMHKCGKKCFLNPKTMGFPICQKLEKASDECQLDCRGILAAKVRAAQWHYNDVRNVADAIGEEKGCRWSE